MRGSSLYILFALGTKIHRTVVSWGVGLSVFESIIPGFISRVFISVSRSKSLRQGCPKSGSANTKSFGILSRSSMSSDDWLSINCGKTNTSISIWNFEVNDELLSPYPWILNDDLVVQLRPRINYCATIFPLRVSSLYCHSGCSQ